MPSKAEDQVIAQDDAGAPGLSQHELQGRSFWSGSPSLRVRHEIFLKPVHFFLNISSKRLYGVIMDSCQHKFDIEIHLPSMSWNLWGLSEKQLLTVAPRAARSVDLVKERILQRYVEACDFEVLFFCHTWGATTGKGFVPAHLMSAERSQVDACWVGNRKVIDRYLGFVRLEAAHNEFYNMSVIDVRGLKRWAVRMIPGFATNALRTITLREAATKVWSRFGKNATAMIQTWMRKTTPRGKESGPIFCPVDLAAPGDPRGSRLDLSDVVSVGLIHWLLRHGVSYSDFEGPGEIVISGRD